MSINFIGGVGRGRVDLSPAPNKALQSVKDYIFGGPKVPQVNLSNKFTNSFNGLAGSFLNSLKQGGVSPNVAATVKDGYLNFTLSQSNILQLSKKGQNFAASQYSAVQAGYKQSGGIANFKVPGFSLDSKNSTTNLQYFNQSTSELVKKGNNLYFTQSSITKIGLEIKGGNVSI
jgi:hypothetical protein